MLDKTDIHYQTAANIPFSLQSSYLLGLAAVRRGLNVSYETYLGDASKSFFRIRPDFTGGYLRIGDGERTYFFDRSRGEKSFTVDSNASRFKGHAKKIFQSKGVSTPQGREFSAKSIGAAQKFLEKTAQSKFIVKPASGSLGKGVVLGLSAEEAIKLISDSNMPMIVEEMIVGPEYRVYVVGETAVGTFERIAPKVVGDGMRTVQQLIDARNQLMIGSPLSEKSSVDLLSAMGFLARSGLSLDDKPKYLEHITLDDRKFGPGRDGKDVTGSVPEAVTAEAVKAVQAIGLPNAGVDVCFDSERQCAYVLEVNARAHIGWHSFPTLGDGQGLAVPDAILDFYFPASKTRKRYENFALDFEAIQCAMATGAVERVSPITPKDSWILRHVPLSCSIEEAERIVNMLRLVTIHVNWWRKSDGDNQIDAYFLKPGLEGFLKTVRASKTAVVTREVDRLICSAA
jgi:D-alanine-D-alanine ligase-like ATP-grasp enzyme